KSFIEGLPGDEDNLAIVTAIMTMAKRFKLNVIAEGVENEEQAECLKALGCYAAQGFYYSPPISIDELETLFVRGANPPYDI
ncbi:EAL domain-containing protein, partial [Acinetobacter baumannii]